MKSRVRTSAIVVHNEKILTFEAIDPTSQKRYYFLPGGEIQEDETAPEAAVRETFEETGYTITVDTESNIDKEYVFHWNGEDYLSLTIFYRGFLTNPFQTPKPVQDAAYNKGAHWIPVSEIDKIFSYTQEICDAINALVKN